VHDLGHTPFGHAGEDVLNELLADQGGFNHNHQSLRVVDILEQRYARHPGLNLSYEVREGIVKHETSAPITAPGFDREQQPTLEAATPGDLSFALPFRYLQGIIEMIHVLDGLMPGVALPSTLLYGAEVKFYSSRLKLNRYMETEIKNMFAAGDGAGVSRGLVQASASGVLAGREILRRMGKSSSPPEY